MSLKHREALAEQIVNEQPKLGNFLTDHHLSVAIVGSWDFMSYSFQRGFEQMWDLARVDLSGLLTPPLLSLWRQSIELCLKASLLELVGVIEGRPGHDLDALLNLLIQACASRGLDADDELTENVRAMVRFAQSFDPSADRFRYPEGRTGKSYPAITVDFDALYQAHWIITTWCEGAVMEIKGDF